jgi:hypothetical protein
LLTALKRQKLISTEEQHAKMLDPFVSVLTDALNSKHVKVKLTLVERKKLLQKCSSFPIVSAN